MKKEYTSYVVTTERRFFPCEENEFKNESYITSHWGVCDEADFNLALAIITEKYSKVGFVTNIEMQIGGKHENFDDGRYFGFDRNAERQTSIDRC